MKRNRKTMWENQAWKSTTSKRVNIDFFFPEFSATKIVTWKFHMEKSTNSIYYMILGRDLLTTLGMDLKFSDNVIIGEEVTYKWCSSPMFYVSNYNFKSIIDKTVKPEESFFNLYIDKCHESDSAINSTRIMRRILDAKYQKDDLNKVMTEHCQHITAAEIHIILHLLNKSEDMFDGTLGMWNTTPVDLELKDEAKPVFSQPYPVTKLDEAMFIKELKTLMILGVLK